MTVPTETFSNEGRRALYHIPWPALVLTVAGALPFLFLSIAPFMGFEPFGRPPIVVLALYALTILTFMGAIHWGLAMTRPAADTTWSYVASVVPALVGWFSVAFLPMPVALRVIAVSFALLLLYDIRAARLLTAPPWYPVLRIPVTLVVVATLLLASIVA